MPADVGQVSILSDGLALQVSGKIGERVGARVVVELVLPRKAAECEQGMGADQVRPCRCDVEGVDFGPLILWADHLTVGPETPIIDNQSRPGCGVLAVIRIGRLEPRARESEVQY